MTDKQIIIDEIDVSGCVAFKYDGIKKPLCRAGGVTSVYKSCLCAGNPNCYYKQLKRKEQEYKKLKAENEKMEKGYIELTEIVSPYIDDFTGYNEELKGFDIVLCVKELMQQLDLLKAENEKLKKTVLQTCPNCGEAYLNHDGAKLIDKNFKLEQVLQGIKVIAEAITNGTHFSDDVESHLKEMTNKILEKINEVEDV